MIVICLEQHKKQHRDGGGSYLVEKVDFMTIMKLGVLYRLSMN